MDFDRQASCTIYTPEIQLMICLAHVCVQA